MSATLASTGTLEAALRQTVAMLGTNPAASAEQAREILKVIPSHPDAQLLLARALRLLNEFTESESTLRKLTADHPRFANGYYELALVVTALGRHEESIPLLRKAVALQPAFPAAWTALGDHLSASGDSSGADAAYSQQVRYSSSDPRLLEAGAALVDNDLPKAEMLLRQHLRERPTDVAAIRMFAEVAVRIGRFADAENLLARCLELSPSFTAARHNYALVLHRQYKSTAALPIVDELLRQQPGNPSYTNLKAAILGRLGEYEQAIELYRQVLTHYPTQSKVWMSFGHALKTAGRQDESVAAYRKSIVLQPGLGETWWSLANLKTFRFTDEEIAAMRTQIARNDLTEEDRFHFEFALAKALEDRREFDESFKYYQSGNARRRKSIGYDSAESTRHVERSRLLFTREFFAARSNWGSPSPDPIFVVGLPRAGSTLVEQILSSHPMVEGTMELPDLGAIAREVGFQQFATLNEAKCRELGEQYLTLTRVQRKTAAPFFIDKMPNNFIHIGLLHLILPNAKIIDARRHPMGCCFSAFKQHFARGQHFTYGLEDIEHFYADYVELMAHFDAVLPGRVHRVIYERMVDDTEDQVRKLLAYCGLEFDERCLRFYENERAVRTASSEQVRKPIYRDGVDQWRNFESHLGPLNDALGACLESYPQAPPYEWSVPQRAPTAGSTDR